MEIAQAWVSLLPSLKGFGSDAQKQISSQLDPVSRKTGSAFGSKLGLAMKTGLAAGGVALAAFGKASLDAASDAQQSLGATETIFGKFARGVIKNSNDAAQEFGLSANEYRENSNLIGALFKNQGVALKDLGGATDNMIGKAADLAATFGGDTSTAVEALSAAFKGEFDSLEKYGISLKASTISAELAARGQDKLTGAALAAATQQATTDLIFRQSKDSLGAFGKESDTLAGQQQRLGAQFENMKATIGTALLPVATQFFGFLNTTALPALSSVGSYVSENFAPAFERVRAAVAGFLGGSGGDVSGWAANIKSVFTDVTTIARTLWDTFGKDIVRYATTAFKNVQQIVGGGLNVIAGIFKTISAIMKGDWSGAWDGIKQIARGAADVVAGLVKQLFNVLKTVTSAGWKVIKAAFSTAWDGLKEVVKNGVDKVVDFMEKLPGRILDGIGDVTESLLSIGVDLMAGLAKGIRNGAESVISTIKSSVTDKLPGFVKKALGIASPSKVMAEIARWIPEGLAKGIAENAYKPAEAIQKVTDALKARAEGMKSVLDGLRSAFDSLKSSVASAFTPDLFQSTSYADFITRARDSMGDLRALRQAFKKLRGWGVSSQFLAQLFASGQTPLILDLATQGKFEAQIAGSAFDQTQNLANRLGVDVAGNQYAAQTTRVVNKLDRLEKAIDRVGPAVGKALNGAAANGRRRSTAA